MPSYDHKATAERAQPAECVPCEVCGGDQRFGWHLHARCSGASDCSAGKHIHGCFADRDGANCDDPEDHQ